jgi:hypothetical protein
MSSACSWSVRETLGCTKRSVNSARSARFSPARPGPGARSARRGHGLIPARRPEGTAGFIRKGPVGAGTPTFERRCRDRHFADACKRRCGTISGLAVGSRRSRRGSRPPQPGPEQNARKAHERIGHGHPRRLLRLHHRVQVPDLASPRLRRGRRSHQGVERGRESNPERFDSRPLCSPFVPVRPRGIFEKSR